MTTNEELLKRIEQLERENAELRKVLNRAKNPDPVQRPTLDRVRKAANNSGITVERWKHGGYIVKFGNLKHWFRRLKTLWEIFTSDSWELCQLFPPKTVLPPTAPRRRVRRISYQSLCNLVYERQHWWHADRIPYS